MIAGNGASTWNSSISILWGKAIHEDDVGSPAWANSPMLHYSHSWAMSSSEDSYGNPSQARELVLPLPAVAIITSYWAAIYCGALRRTHCEIVVPKDSPTRADPNFRFGFGGRRHEFTALSRSGNGGNGEDRECTCQAFRWGWKILMFCHHEWKYIDFLLPRL